MGGFEGGDEGGYWDIDTLPSLMDTSKNSNREKSFIEKSDSGYSIKAPAKVTVFFKITGYKDGNPTFLSRVVRLQALYDTISFVPCTCETFTLEGCADIALESNSIYKAYKALKDYTNDPDIEDFFYTHKVVVTKRIATSAGLGGSASDAAAFMHLLKEVCNLILSTDELAKVASSIGADLPFFIYNYPSANVSGCGEVVVPVEEEPLNFELYTTNIAYDRTLVCQTFKEQLLADISLSSFEGWEQLDSKDILERTEDPVILNDLYAACCLAYPDPQKETKKGWFFSGLGSTLFKIAH